jgi:hypothetical protein
VKVVLATALFGALALVLTGAPAPTSTVAGAQKRAAHTQTVLPAPSPNPPAGPATLTGVPARQLSLHGSRTPEAPLFIGRSRASTGAAATPAPKASTSPTTISAPKIAVYSSLNKPGIVASDNPFPLTPPDSTGTIGPNNYVEMANSIIHVWGRDLSSISSMPLHTFVGDPTATDPFCDPQIQWDQAAGRWLILYSFCNTQTTSQAFIFAWSKTSNPSDLANGWCVIGVNTSPLLLDYPKLGHNSKYIIIGGNFYDETSAPTPNPPFATALIAWAALPANGDTTCPSSITVNHTSLSTRLLNGDGVTPAFTPVPVNTMTGAANGYIVSSYDVGGNVQAPTPQSKLAVWHLDSSGVLHQDLDVGVASYSAPAPAPQLGSTNKIDTLDGRLTQAQGDPASGIWTQHTVLGGAGAMVTWYQLTAVGTSLTLAQSGNLSSVSDSIFNAAISPSYSARGAVIEYSRSSATIDPVIAAQVRVKATPPGQMAPGEIVLASSSAADAETVSCNVPAAAPCRWGDYSAATPDPVQPDVVWGTNEFNTSSGAMPSWSDENFAIWAIAPPFAPTIASASAGDQFACVRWTLSTFSSGAPDLTYTIRAYQGVTVVRTVTINAPASVACVNGLTNGTAYTLTVSATNLAGPGAESAPSAPMTPVRGAAPSSSAAPPARTTVNPAPVPPPPPGR